MDLMTTTKTPTQTKPLSKRAAINRAMSEETAAWEAMNRSAVKRCDCAECRIQAVQS